jgi:hypothetical protein
MKVRDSQIASNILLQFYVASKDIKKKRISFNNFPGKAEKNSRNNFEII